MRCLLPLALLAVSTSACVPPADEDLDPAGPDTAGVEDDGKADGSELRVRAGRMTVWVDRAVTIRVVDGEPRAVVKGRTSRNLDGAFAFVPDDPFGEATVVGPRSFEVVLRGNGNEINSIFSGLPLLVRLDAPSDPDTDYTLQLNLRPAFTAFEGSSSLFVSSTTRPIFVGKDAPDPLRYSTHVQTFGALTVTGAGSPELVPALEGFDVLMTYGDLDTAWRAGGKVTFQAGTAQKRARLGARTTSIALTTLDPYEAFPAPTCELETYNCLFEHQGVDLATCGDYREVSRCAYANICEVTDAAPLQLDPIDLGFAFDGAADTYRAGCTTGGTWCSLGAIETFMVPECLAEEPTLEQVVAQAAARTDDQDFAAGAFAAGTVLDRTTVQATPVFSTAYSAGGPGLFGAIDGHMGAGDVRAWSYVEEVPCHNCTDFRSKLVLWWPAAFRVVVIEAGHGFDS